MTALGRFFACVAEKLAHRYYEGPEPPPRLHDEVRVFAALHPQASTHEWKDFAARVADNAYRDGFARGHQWAERLWPGPSQDPEVLAEQRAHDFSLPAWYLQQLEAQPSPVQGMTAEQAARLRHQLAHAGARLVPLEPARPQRR